MTENKEHGIKLAVSLTHTYTVCRLCCSSHFLQSLKRLNYTQFSTASETAHVSFLDQQIFNLKVKLLWFNMNYH